MSRWLGLCEQGDVKDLAQAVLEADATAELELVRDGDALRLAVLAADEDEIAVAVGPVRGCVSGVNLAAAIARDGNARQVLLAARGVSGSLRSRAVQAGVNAVVDLDEVMGDGANGGGDEGTAPDGGQVSAVPGTSPVAELTPEPAPEGGRAPVIVFCSGRGGVGKTSVAVMAAAQAAAWGMRAVVVDLDLSCGNAHSLLGVARPSDLARLSDEGEVSAGLVDELAVASAAGPCVMGPCDRPEAAELAVPHVGDLLVRASEAFDLVVVDTSPTFTDAVAQAAQLADRLVIVSDGRAGTLSALSRTSGLAVRLGVARTRIARLENRANPRAKADLSLARAEVGLEAARVYRAFEGGEEVADLFASGLVGDLVGSGSPFATSMATTIAQLLAELGCLPDDAGAARAAEGSTTRRWPGLFGRRREAS